MKLDSSAKAEIRRLKRVEGWSTYAIARHFQVHQTTVGRALRADLGMEFKPPKPSQKEVFPPSLEPYKAYLSQEAKKRKGKPTARILANLKEQGFLGSLNTLRRGLAFLRQKTPRAFTKREVFAGDEAQVDWCELGKIKFQRYEAKVYVLVIVLSWSRDIYAQACLDMQFDTLARAHVRAFKRFGGVPRYCLYDNMRTVVTSTRPGYVEFNHKFLTFAREYGFKLRNCNPRQPQEKGRVERSIRYFKESFMPETSFLDLDDFNHQLLVWLDSTRQRPWPDAKQFKVCERSQREQRYLGPLAPTLWYPKKRTICRVAKTPYISFESCKYSVPPKHVGENVSVERDDEKIEIFSDSKLIASHRRERDKGKVIEDPEHIGQLRRLQGPGSYAVLKNALVRMLPPAGELIRLKLERGDKIGRLVAQIFALTEKHGKDNVSAAIELALEQGTVDLEAIKLLIKSCKPQNKNLSKYLLNRKINTYETEHQSIENYAFLSPKSIVNGNKNYE